MCYVSSAKIVQDYSQAHSLTAVLCLWSCVHPPSHFTDALNLLSAGCIVDCWTIGDPRVLLQYCSLRPTGEMNECSSLIPSHVDQQHNTTGPGKASFEPMTTVSQSHCTHKHPYKYALLPIPISMSRKSGNRMARRLLFPTALLLLVFFLGNLIARNIVERLPRWNMTPEDSDYYDVGAPFAPYKTQKLWAAYSPYYSVEEYKPPPRDCQLTQVNILQRHGARYPTLGQAARIAQALMKLQSATSYNDERFRFISNYQYDLGADDLLPYGELESFVSGRKSFIRYSTLADGHNLPFVRASGSKRVIQSALKWSEGFSSGSGGTLDTHLSLIIPEDGYHNNTLEDKSCPNADHPEAPLEKWQSIYAQPIADRFNAVARGMSENLTSGDAHSLISLCALETVAKEEFSPFCHLFTNLDFEGFEYAIDLDKFYYTGHGAELGPVQGVGYINELIARLTDTPVEDHTQTNHTLDSDPGTFPLRRGIYVDLSHDNLMVAVISAMGLFKDNERFAGGTLDPTRRPESREWFTSRIVPFSGKLVVERMECGLGIDNVARKPLASEMERRWRRKNRESAVYVRVLMNDAVQGLDFCKGSDENGLCLLSSFTESQAYATEDGQGDWEMCFE